MVGGKEMVWSNPGLTWVLFGTVLGNGWAKVLDWVSFGPKLDKVFGLDLVY